MAVTLSKNWDFFFQRRLKLLPKLADSAVKKTAIQGKRKVRNDTPVDTGLLKRSWATRRQVLGAWILSNLTPYASFVEEGTGLFGPHKTAFGNNKGQKARRMLAKNRAFIRKRLLINLRDFIKRRFR